MDFRNVTFKQFLTLEEGKRDNFTIRTDPDGTEVKVYPPSGPIEGSRAHVRANIRAHSSRHIGGHGDAKKNRSSGVRAANTQGLPVIGQGNRSKKVTEEMKPLNPARVAVRNTPNLINKNAPNDPHSYEYRQQWRGKPKSKAGREHHEVAHDVAKNKARLDKKAKKDIDRFSALKNYLPPRPRSPREGNFN